MTVDERVVVGVDGSDCSARALRWAADHARRLDATLVVLHAWSAPGIGFPGMKPLYADSEFEAHAATIVDEVLAAADPIQVDVERRLVKAHPAQAMIDASAEAVVVVLGSRGMGGVTGAMLGSVSQRVAGQAHCPVVIVPPATDQR